MIRNLTVLVVLASALSLQPPVPSARAQRPWPLVIAHRGASGERPEHTLAAYELAIERGADYIEPDLVFTRDGVLVARHENEISGTTDVASRPEFASRKATKHIDGNDITGFFTEDFTLAELETLRARERLPDLRPGNVRYDGVFRIPTFEQIIRLAKVESRKRRRTIGIYPETKHPSYFASIGLPFEHTLVNVLHRHGYRGPNAPVFIQSFEVGNLKTLRTLTRVPLVQLIDASGKPFDDRRSYADMVTRHGLAEVATYADAIGVHKNLLLPRGHGDVLLTHTPTSLVSDAHEAGLRVHAWTFRSENHFLPADLRRGDDPRAHGDAVNEYERFYALGIDGVFSEFIATAVAARRPRSQ